MLCNYTESEIMWSLRMTA